MQPAASDGHQLQFAAAVPDVQSASQVADATLFHLLFITPLRHILPYPLDPTSSYRMTNGWTPRWLGVFGFGFAAREYQRLV